MPAVMNVVFERQAVAFFLRSSSFYAHVYDGAWASQENARCRKKRWDAHKVVFLALLITCAWHKTQHGIIIQRN